MPSRRANKAGDEARNVKVGDRWTVLHEAGFKCSNPRCRYPMSLDVHHLHYVADGGSNDPANLLPLWRGKGDSVLYGSKGAIKYAVPFVRRDKASIFSGPIPPGNFRSSRKQSERWWR